MVYYGEVKYRAMEGSVGVWVWIERCGCFRAG